MRRARILALLLAYAVCPSARADSVARQNSPHGPDPGSEGPGAAGAGLASVAFDLPAPRGDLPLPLEVVYTGGNQVGEAGLGWALTHHYVRRSRALSRRKPAYRFSEEAPEPVERMFLHLSGRPILMAPTSSPDLYLPLVDDTYLEMRAVPGGWAVRDLAGREYTFRRLPALGDDDLWMLTRIADRGGANRVDLTYAVHDMIAPPPSELGGDSPVKELLLTGIAYSHDPAGVCPKYRVELNYVFGGDLVPYPEFLELAFTEGHLRARTRLLDIVRLYSHPTVDCGGEALLQTYRFSYQPDGDRGRPRLTAVDLFGAGDPGGDPATSLPLARYRYGTATQGGSLVYGAVSILSLPASIFPDGFTTTIHLADSTVYGTNQFFRDMNGDGRADYVYPAGGDVHLAANVPDGAGTDLSTFAASASYPVQDPADLPIGVGDTVVDATYMADGLFPVITTTWNQLIDWNGDGRVDRVYARLGRDPAGKPSPDHWKVLLNRPGPSGDPSDITWIETHVDISAIRAEVAHWHDLSPVIWGQSGPMHWPGNEEGYLPLARSIETKFEVVDEKGALRAWRPSTVTVMKLQDLNGDGFPDYVWSQFDSLLTWEGICRDDGGCFDVYRLDIPTGNWLLAYYHTGPLMAGVPGGAGWSTWRTRPVVWRGDGGCGIERHTTHYRIGSGEPPQRFLACGLAEVNGDGLVDYVIDQRRTVLDEETAPEIVEIKEAQRVLRQTGLPEEQEAALPENVDLTYSDLEKKRAIELPGPVDLLLDHGRPLCADAPDDTPYEVRQLSGLVDLTGDGLADYVWFGTLLQVHGGEPLDYPEMDPDDDGGDERWWVMVGAGSRFRPPIRIITPSGTGFELQRSVHRCGGDESHTTAALFDLEGDGLIDLVESTGPNRIRVTRLTDGTQRARALSAGRLTRIENGYGAATEIRYGSAKAEPLTPHQLPFPEVVVVSTQVVTERGLAQGDPLARTRYAYGHAELVYDPLLARWVFPGYGRRVEIAGGQTSPGLAYVVDSVRPAEAPTDDRRFALLGRVRDVHRLDEVQEPNAWALLGLTVPGDRRARANRHVEHAGHPIAYTPPDYDTAFREECYDVLPFGPSPGLGELDVCRRPRIAYAAEETAWEGAAYPSSASVATRTAVLSLDARGRPLRVLLAGDRTASDDDLCLTLTYADGAVPLEAVSSARLGDCSEPITFHGLRFRYDDLPEGQASLGRVTHQIVERYDPDGALLGDFAHLARELDALGNVLTATTESGTGQSRAQKIAYDPFGLVATSTIETASDTDAVLVSTADYDPATLQPLAETDPNELVMNYEHDGFGRLLSVAAWAPDDDGLRLLKSVDYLGYGAGDPAGRRVHETVAEGALERTSFLDELGRPRFQEQPLGADYDGKTLVRGYTLFDGLGRVRFAAAPFLAGEPAPHWGTTSSYLSDGKPACRVLGLGVQTATTTDQPAGRFATCWTYSFAGHRALVRAQGPVELDPTAPQFGTFTESQVSATGRLLSRARWAGGARLELMTLGYDRLGSPASITRHATPATAEVPVTWTMRHDSLGQLVSLTEPASATRAFRYDQWGDLLETSWQALGGAQRQVVSRYDGFGRVVQSEDVTDGVPDPTRTVEYFYDFPSGDDAQVEPDHLLGRLSHTVDGTLSTYFGYDGSGRTKAITRVAHADGLPHTERRRHGLTGALEALAFDLPDHPPEEARYLYDSARRVRQIDWDDGSTVSPIFQARSIDPFGRYLEVALGNGVIEKRSYRADQRRELLSVRTIGPQGTLTRSFLARDAEMRLLDEERVGGLGGGGGTRRSVYEYDAADRLGRTRTWSGSSLTRDDKNAYDGLGNLKRVVNALTSQTTDYVPAADDPDRLCAVLAGSLVAPGVAPACGYSYDERGNAIQIGSVAPRIVGYDGRSRPVSLRKGAQQATIAYDAFGHPARVQLTGAGAADRDDTRYGSLIERARYLEADGTASSYLVRRVPGPLGMVAELRRTIDEGTVVVYPHGDTRGLAATSSGTGAPLQEVAYTPFGAVESTSGSPPGSSGSSHYLWNGGDAMAPFGVTLLGGRAYEPATGRFLGRDPLLAARGASSTHPYAFAEDDPVNLRDPTGREGELTVLEGVGPMVPLDSTDEFVVHVDDPATTADDAWFQEPSSSDVYIDETEEGGTIVWQVECGEAGCYHAGLIDGIAMRWHSSPWVIEVEGEAPRIYPMRGPGEIFLNSLLLLPLMAAAPPGVSAEDWQALRPFPYDDRDLEMNSGMEVAFQALVSLPSLPLDGRAAGGALRSAEEGALALRVAEEVAPQTRYVPKNPLNISTAGWGPDQVRNVTQHARLANQWHAVQGPKVVRSTRGPLRKAAKKAASAERARAEAAGTPYQGHVGHVPDVAAGGSPEAEIWLDTDPSVNSRIGGYLGSRIGEIIDGYLIDGWLP